MVTRVGVSSDLHINMNFDLTPELVYEICKRVTTYLDQQGYSIFIINGDISYDPYYNELFLEYIQKIYKGKVYVLLGNHDIVKDMTLDNYLNDKPKGVDNYLVDEPIELKDKIIYGLNGFSDYTFSDGIETEEELKEIKDYVYNRVKMEYFNLSEEDYPLIIDKQLLKLDEQIVKDKSNKEKILCTHFIPHADYVLKTKDKSLLIKNMMMGSKKTGKYIEDKKISKVYFGHTHRRLSITEPENMIKNDVKYYCNPIGTYREWIKWGYIGKEYERCTLDLWMEMFKKTLQEI